MVEQLKQEQAEQLIIIGNGFDLHCGLKTRFDDYFQYATQKIRVGWGIKKGSYKTNPYELMNKRKTSPFNRRLSWWDLYFIKLKDSNVKNWADFEKHISLLVRSEAKNGFLEKCVNYEDCKNLEIIDEEIAGEAEYYSVVREFNSEAINCLAIYLQLINIESTNKDNEQKQSKIDLEKLIDILFDELKKFEHNLNDFLSVQLVDGAEGYQFHSKVYKEEFLKTINSISNNKKYNVLSFNYTFFPKIKKYTEDEPGFSLKKVSSKAKPKIQRETSIDLESNGEIMTYYKLYDDIIDENCLSIVNIHGKLNASFYSNNVSDVNSKDDIIVGIDSSNIKSDERVYKFTKTSRLFDLKGLSDNNCIQNGIKEIKFFGHSLAPADYSYFQSIFDFYHIYDSDIKLIFYYADRRSEDYMAERKEKIEKEIKKEKVEGKIKMEEDNEKIISQRLNQELEQEKKASKADTVNNVIRLIEKYGETLDNKDHGKNLLHKLLLEGRLRVEYIE